MKIYSIGTIEYKNLALEEQKPILENPHFLGLFLSFFAQRNLKKNMSRT